MADPLVRERIDAWMALLQAQAAVTDAVEAELVAECDLPLAWHEVLVRLSPAEQGLRMRELASAVPLSRSGLTRLADRMEQAGLIERSACPSDRRGTLAVLTQTGRRKLLESAPVFRGAVEANLSRHLSTQELSSLRRLLRRIADGIGRDSDGSRDSSDLDGVIAVPHGAPA